MTDAFKDAFGLAPLDMVVCPMCVVGEILTGQPVTPTPNEIKEYESWCSKARCPTCLHEWYVCRTCTNLRTVIDSEAQLYQHIQRYHHDDANKHKSRRLSKRREKPSDCPIYRRSVPTSKKKKIATKTVTAITKDNSLVIPGKQSTEDCEVRNGLEEVHDFDSFETPTKQYGGIPTAVKNCNFTREESTNYFANNFYEKMGISYLISQSFYSGSIQPQEISNDDRDILLKLTLLVKTLTVSQCGMMGDFLEPLLKKVNDVEEFWKDNVHRVRTINKGRPVLIPPIPKNRLEIRYKIRNEKGSFLSLLPHPKIWKLSDGHVYVLPSDCIQHFLAFGVEPMEFDVTVPRFPVTNVNESPRGAEVAANLSKVSSGKSPFIRHFNLSYLEWKDDCESAKSNKKSKHSMWLFTMTIFVKERTGDSPIGTFPVAIGPKGKSHDFVERIIGDNIKLLRSCALPGIFGSLGSEPPIPCTFSADMYMCLADQPERRGGNSLHQGNSRRHARWRYVLDYSACLDVIPACVLCFRKMVECDSEVAREDVNFDCMAWKTMKCSVCSNWCYDISNELLQFERSEGAPQNYLLGGETGSGPLSPIVLSYDTIEKTMQTAFENVSKGIWTKRQGIVYLSDNCINEKYSITAMNRARNVYAIATAREEWLENEERYRELLKDQEQHPHKYEMLPSPAVYSRGVPLKAWVDTPMHLVLLGVCRTVFRRIGKWSSNTGRKKTFVSLATSLLTQLDDLKISWLTFVPSTFMDEWGGWVSKHYASLARVSRWLFGELMSCDDAPPYTDPPGDPNKWKVPELSGWLRARGLSTVGKRAILLQRVLQYLLGDPTKIPPIQPVKYGSAEEMIEMVRSLVVLVSTVFQDSVGLNTRDIVDLRVRIFLSAFEIFDAPLRGKEKEPTWKESYNFVCLKNLGECIDEFGPCRRWFKGKWLGERYVSTVKTERSHCPPSNLYYNLMRRLHRTKAIEMLSMNTTKRSNERELLLNTRVFGTEVELETHFRKHLALPVIITKDGSTCCLQYETSRNIGNRVVMRKLSRDPANGKHGIIYWQYKLTEEKELLSNESIADYGVLLPQPGNADIGLYTIVTKNWSSDMYGNYNFTKEINQNKSTGSSGPIGRVVASKLDAMENNDTSGWI